MRFAVLPLAALKIVGRALKYFLWTVLIFVLAANFVFPAPRDVAFRNLSPHASACQAWKKTELNDVLSKHHNDEIELLASEPDARAWSLRLQCAVQTHTVPTGRPEGPLRYHLAFLEFQENADPYFLHVPEGDPSTSSMPQSQLDAITTHLTDIAKRKTNNHVIAFIHGWRHDASVGDINVADARLYGASAARHIATRCAAAGKQGPYCNTEVTVVYVGWRGQRVNENGMARAFSNLESHVEKSPAWYFKQARQLAGDVAAVPTLFDRKPISELIGPSVVTALRSLDVLIHKKMDSKPENPTKEEALERDHEWVSDSNRLIVFGHSLGGNLLASSLRDYIVRMLHRRTDKATSGTFLSPVGKLAVLINPASEAQNWAEIQRAVLDKIAFRSAEAVGDITTESGHVFFPDNQPPVVVSITSARSWPPGGFREGDCVWLKRGDGEKEIKVAAQKEKNRTLLKENVDYDWATFDLFPAFKMDFRPAANTVDRFAFRMEGVTPKGLGCDTTSEKPWWGVVGRTIGWAGHKVAMVLRVLPFMNTNVEQTRTIGHLDPMRPPMNVLTNFEVLPFSQIGTTHQLTSLGTDLVAKFDERETYSMVGSNPEDRYGCDPARNWLARAKLQRKEAEKHAGEKEAEAEALKKGMDPKNAMSAAAAAKYYATFWDSNDLQQAPPKLRFVHGFQYGGMAAITRANDPFWNVRAFGDVVSQHNGYKFPEFICAMSQLAMDEVAADPTAQRP